MLRVSIQFVSNCDPGRVLFVYMKGVNISWVVVNMRLLVTIVPHICDTRELQNLT